MLAYEASADALEFAPGVLLRRMDLGPALVPSVGQSIHARWATKPRTRAAAWMPMREVRHETACEGSTGTVGNAASGWQRRPATRSELCYPKLSNWTYLTRAEAKLSAVPAMVDDRDSDHPSRGICIRDANQSSC